MDTYQKAEWEKLVFEAVENLDSDCQLACDEAIISMDKYKSALESLMVRVYNSGYMAGHHDTVEGHFVDIHHSDMSTYHGEEVEELRQELMGA